MMKQDRVYNFSAGPATLPRAVMEKAQAEFVDFRGLGYGLVEASHRSKAFSAVIEAAEADIRKLMNISDDYAVLFLQGGASLQFAMAPMNLAREGKPMLYADTGAWTTKAIKEAKRFGEVKLLYDGSTENYRKIGDVSEWKIDPDAAYAYICSNNTINGTQYHFFPETGDVPLIADMSSDIMSRQVDVSRFSMIFAGAQKNLGPAGMTLVILRKDLAARAADSVPTMLKYTTHIDKGSMFNTPPTFSIYMVGLVAAWLLEQGGLAGIQKINESKSDALYETIDMSAFYQGTAEPADRSRMNVCFRLPSEELEKTFVEEAAAVGLVGLKGHRSVGGLRASIYNAMPMDGISRLIDFMVDFEKTNG
jgi:phosphoserine aminotransferase